MSKEAKRSGPGDLRRWPALLEALLRASPDGIAVVESSNVVVAVNDPLCALFGWRRQEMVGTNLRIWLERLGAGAVECWAELEKQVHLEGPSTKAGFSIDSEAGTRHFRVSASTVGESPPGKKGPLIAFWREISGHKRVGESLLFRVKLEKLIASVSTLFVNLGLDEIDACIEFALEKIAQFIGADRGYVFQSDDQLKRTDNTHEWCADGIKPQIDELQGVALCDELPWFAEHIVNRKTTYIPRVSELPAEAKRERERFEGQNIRSLVVVPMTSRAKLVGFLGFDVIRRDVHWAEEAIAMLAVTGEVIASTLERTRADLALQASEEKYRTIFENIQDVYYEARLDGTLIEVSPSVSVLSGFEREELIGKPFAGLSASTVEGKRLWERILDRGYVTDCELAVKSKAGTDVSCSMNAKLFYDRKGVPAKVCGMLRDVSEHQQLEERRRHSQKIEAVGELAGGIAHDFNNLLTGILGHANLIKLDAEPGSSIYDAAETIEKTSQRASELTQQLLGFARRGQHQIVPIDMHRTIKDVVKLITPTFDRSIRITLDLTARNSTVVGDPGQIQQALMNLAVNARDAMPDGGELTFHSEVVDLNPGECDALPGLSPGRYLVVEVVDTGIGIPDDVQSRVFEPFFTTKKQGEGIGMGLAMVYGIVSNHGGCVRIKSSPGEGATFRLFLPLEKGKATDTAARSEGELLGGTERILLVEDEAVVRNVTSHVLRRLGYQVETVANGAEAVSYYRSHHGEIDLVIIDMIMPEMGGGECFEALKRLNPNVKAILATGYSTNGKAQNILNAGVRRLIQKPFRMSVLATAVRDVLDEGRT
ncbi:MAG: PAS domain S-box protein [Candidatus Coatesbacteria bacterium]|nr:PAS domain S-box protein [Candidatus Coatesbacteria bacterium]